MLKSLKDNRLLNMELKDGQFVARNIDSGDPYAMEKIYTFRHKVFSKELGWVFSLSKEHDEYDDTSVHFAVFSDSGDIVGYSRLNLAEGGFMLEKEFSDLIGSTYSIRKESDTVEGSRFTVSPDLRRSKSGFKVSELLCKTMCRWCKINGIRYWYLVMDKNYLDFLQRFFPIQQVGVTKEYQPGLTSSAVFIDLKKLGAEEADSFWSMLGDKPKPDK